MHSGNRNKDWRDRIEGWFAGAIVGGAGGYILTGGAVTAETGQVLWLVMIGLAGSVIAGPRTGTPLAVIAASLPFLATLLAILLWTGAARMAYDVGWAVLARKISIPLAAFTQRDMLFRYGLFFLFLLVASAPAVLAAVCAWHGLRGIAMRIAGKWSLNLKPPTPRARTVILRVWRGTVCLAVVALAILTTFGA
jgi:hypothetical protein